jgi:hypothetical protein
MKPIVQILSRSSGGAGVSPRRGPARPLSSRAIIATVATAGLVLLASACSSGGSSPNGASAGGGAAPTNPQSTSAKLLAYSQCMRSHGVPDFPDPDRTGLIPSTQVKNLTTSPAVIRRADDHCHTLYPTQPGINAPFSSQQKQDYLSAAACMRQHGVPAFPDPVFSGSQVQLPIPPGVDTTSPQFTQARQLCAKKIPAGLPFSANPG